ARRLHLGGERDLMSEDAVSRRVEANDTRVHWPRVEAPSAMQILPWAMRNLVALQELSVLQGDLGDVPHMVF
ncbi:hypothetical protein PENTCL1PPCAC_30103, partial [Pristionchus entomophagus]